MANLFDGANKVKDGVEEIDKILDKLKLTSERLEKIEETFSEVENISPDLLKIRKEIKAIKEDYEDLDLEEVHKTIKNTVNRITDGAFENWKLWGLYFPLVIFVAAFIMVSYFYMVNVRKMAEENKVLSDRINSVYNMHLLDKKFWYNKENQELFLGDYDWIQKKIAEEKKNNKKQYLGGKRGEEILKSSYDTIIFLYGAVTGVISILSLTKINNYKKISKFAKSQSYIKIKFVKFRNT